MSAPFGPGGVLGAGAADETAASLVALQRPCGLVPWFAGGAGDPWNHVEAAMALSARGEWAAAERAYGFLAGAQRRDGAWHAAYDGEGAVVEQRLDTNMTAYVATGVYHHLIASGDAGFAEEMWPVVESALGFVLARQWRGGAICWSVDERGREGDFALLAASCSIHSSLAAAVALATALGRERPEWEAARERLAEAIRRAPAGFADKSIFAMDWYYPALCGALAPASAGARLDSGQDAFVLDGAGVRCRSDRRWVTTAETAEYALALASLGRRREAAQVLASTADKRCGDGAYLTGLVHPERSEFPRGERSSYSAAAVVLADDLLERGVATTAVFAPHEGARFVART